MKKQVQKYFIEVVKWRDHGTCHGWHTLGSIDVLKIDCVTVGLVIREDKEAVYMTATIGANFDEMNGYIKRLKSDIISRKRIGVVVRED